MATVVREAIDRGLEAPAVGRSAAGQRFLDAPPMRVASVDDLLDELGETRGRRA